MKQVKPLPAPLDGQRKKRGGRRYTSCQLPRTLTGPVRQAIIQRKGCRMEKYKFTNLWSLSFQVNHNGLIGGYRD